MNLKFLALFVMIITFQARGQSSKTFEVFFHTGFNSVNLDTENFDVISNRFSFGWYYRSNINLNVGYSLVLGPAGKSNFSGYDFGPKYFFYNHFATQGWNNEGTSYAARPKIAPYVQPLFAQRSLQLDNGDVNFTGLGLKTGVAWNFKRKYLLDFALEYLSLSGPLGGSGTLSYTSTQLSVGIGYPF
jgi:hypothetical protein